MRGRPVQCRQAFLAGRVSLPEGLYQDVKGFGGDSKKVGFKLPKPSALLRAIDKRNQGREVGQEMGSPVRANEEKLRNEQRGEAIEESKGDRNRGGLG